MPADFVVGSAEARVDAACLDGSCSAHRGLGAVELAGRAGLVDLTLLRGRRVLRSVRGARWRVGVLCGPCGAGGLLIGAGVGVLWRGVGKLGCGPVGCVAWVGVLWGGALWLWSRAVRCVVRVDVLWSRAVWWWCGVVWGVARVGVLWRGAGRLGCWPVRCVVRVGVLGSRAGRLWTGAVGCVVRVGVLRGRAGVRSTMLRGRRFRCADVGEGRLGAARISGRACRCGRVGLRLDRVGAVAGMCWGVGGLVGRRGVGRGVRAARVVLELLAFGADFGFGGLVAADVRVVLARIEGVAGDGAAVVVVGDVFVVGGVEAGAVGGAERVRFLLRGSRIRGGFGGRTGLCRLAGVGLTVGGVRARSGCGLGVCGRAWVRSR